MNVMENCALQAKGLHHQQTHEDGNVIYLPSDMLTFTFFHLYSIRVHTVRLQIEIDNCSVSSQNSSNTNDFGS